MAVERDREPTGPDSIDFRIAVCWRGGNNVWVHQVRRAVVHLTIGKGWIWSPWADIRVEMDND